MFPAILIGYVNQNSMFLMSAQASYFGHESVLQVLLKSGKDVLQGHVACKHALALIRLALQSLGAFLLHLLFAPTLSSAHYLHACMNICGLAFTTCLY